MIINTISYDAFVEHATEHFQNQFEEAGQFSDKLDFNVNLPQYKILYDKGHLRIVAAWLEETLVGWAIFLMAPHPYHEDEIFAASDVTYVVPEYRGKGVLSALIESTEELLAPFGVQVINWAVHTDFDFGARLKREGYERETITYGKYIGK